MPSPLSASTRKIVFTALLAAVMLVLQVTGLGILPLPFLPMAVTILHIPVIIGGCLLGWKCGAVLGVFFGLMSFLRSTFAPTVTSFLFSPFYAVGEFHGNFWSLVICFVPRILVGVFSALVYRAITRRESRVRVPVAGAVAGVIGSMTNTLLVMGGAALFFADQYLAATGANEALFLVIGSSVLTNGVPEAILSAVLCAALMLPLRKLAPRT